VANVDPNGTVRALHRGTTKIVAEFNDKTSSSTVIVN
jgi:hypothetical protein